MGVGLQQCTYKEPNYIIWQTGHSTGRDCRGASALAGLGVSPVGR